MTSQNGIMILFFRILLPIISVAVTAVAIESEELTCHSVDAYSLTCHHPRAFVFTDQHLYVFGQIKVENPKGYIFVYQRSGEGLEETARVAIPRNFFHDMITVNDSVLVLAWGQILQFSGEEFVRLENPLNLKTVREAGNSLLGFSASSESGEGAFIYELSGELEPVKKKLIHPRLQGGGIREAEFFNIAGEYYLVDLYKNVCSKVNIDEFAWAEFTNASSVQDFARFNRLQLENFKEKLNMSGGQLPTYYAKPALGKGVRMRDGDFFDYQDNEWRVLVNPARQITLKIKHSGIDVGAGERMQLYEREDRFVLFAITADYEKNSRELKQFTFLKPTLR